MTTMGLDLLNFIEDRLRELPDAVLQFENENDTLVVLRHSDMIAKVEVTEECVTVHAPDRTITCYPTGTERSNVEDFVFRVYWAAVTTVRKYLRRKRAVTHLAYPHIAVTFEDVAAAEGKSPWMSYKTTYALVMKHFLDDNPDQRFELGHTVTHRYGNPEHPADSSGYQDYLGVLLPFRDGAHMFHDAAHLGVPLYAQTPEGWVRLDVPGNSSRLHATRTGEKRRIYG